MEDFVVTEIPTERPKKRRRVEPAEETGLEQVIFFSLEKFSVDTLEAISQISLATGIPYKAFGIAGIKDSCAVTKQEVSLVGMQDLVDAQVQADFLRAIKHLEHISVSDIHLDARDPLYPGNLSGNEFVIVVREADPTVPLEPLMQSLKTSGFANYIGLQRFGKNCSRSEEMGLLYLQRNYPACIQGLLGYDKPWAELFHRTGNAEAAIKAIPSERYWVERRLFMGFQKAPDGTWESKCRYAFLSLPKSIRVLYVHAYCDRIFNLALSSRLGDSVSEVQVGDLVRKEGSDGEPVLISAEDECQRWSIRDVVLPRLGYSVQYPAHHIGQLMRAYLTYDDVSDLEVEMNIMGTLWQVSGDYRHIISEAKGLRWSRLTDTDFQVQFSLNPGQYATMVLREIIGRPKKVSCPRRILFNDSDSEAASPEVV
eukprot:GEMP01029575.1.p1 GENE.GEMP01029575.1~~GEMP01029575.1.p1  ORF type:complete len:453 (+),score=86.60 GEMP01029575.1:84-1361(+)